MKKEEARYQSSDEDGFSDFDSMDTGGEYNGLDPDELWEYQEEMEIKKAKKLNEERSLGKTWGQLLGSKPVRDKLLDRGLKE